MLNFAYWITLFIRLPLLAVWLLCCVLHGANSWFLLTLQIMFGTCLANGVWCAVTIVPVSGMILMKCCRTIYDLAS
jgi:hypothetical protein